jgi:hypothetical protein
MSERLRILVAGELIGDGDHGGATWAVLQWVLGLRDLGHDVVVVEPTPARVPSARSLATFARVVTDHALTGRAAIVTPHRRGHGLRYADVASFAATADAMVNLSGRLRDPELRDGAPTRVYVDLDPGFTQVWSVDGADVGIAHHNRHLTVAARLDGLPNAAVVWESIRPPVALSAWRVADAPPTLGATTVANLRSYGSPSWRGQRLGQKVHALRVLADLPRNAAMPAAIALRAGDGDNPDVARLRHGGWQLLDPDEVAGTTARYHHFVRASAAEIGIAKEGYVVTGCGWTSDRTVAYLASGRPAVLHDTGLRGVLPLGEGVLAFTDVVGAREALAEVRGNYARHQRAARRIAEDLFDARLVLPTVLERLGATV